MGAWGAGSFENDDALDFVVRLEREGEAAVRVVLEEVTGLGARDYLEAEQAPHPRSLRVKLWPQPGMGSARGCPRQCKTGSTGAVTLPVPHSWRWPIAR